MAQELSIDAEKNEINLENNKLDTSVFLLKAVFSTVPIVGSILTEVVGVVIPNQKADRIKLFVEVLAEKVKFIEKGILEVKMKTEKFTDLFEDALSQAARALTDERREYIAMFLKNSLTIAELKHNEEKKLLSILNELNDTEIIWLKYRDLNPTEIDEFEEKHKEIFLADDAPFDASELEFATETLTEDYIRTLRSRGLVDDKRQVTHLGSLFLHYIGLKETFH